MTDLTLAAGTSTIRTSGKTEVSGMQSALIGGLGGMMPIVATVAAGEYQTLSQLTMQDAGYAIGFGLRAVALFFIGAVLVWIHSDVRTRYGAFRLGMTAPALIATVLSSASANAEPLSSAGLRVQEVQVAALDTGAGPATLSDALPQSVLFADECGVIDGLIGRKCK